jgi:hypothetical protein
MIRNIIILESRINRSGLHGSVRSAVGRSLVALSWHHAPGINGCTVAVVSVGHRIAGLQYLAVVFGFVDDLLVGVFVECFEFFVVEQFLVRVRGACRH